MRSFLMILLIALLIAIAGVFIYRYQILQYSAETIIRNNLPDYISVDKIIFDVKDSSLVLAGFKILNPAGFSQRYLLDVGKIICRYRMKGKTILDGVQILDPSFEKPVLNIERLKDGSINLNVMKKELEDKAGAGDQSGAADKANKNLERVKIAALPKVITLPENFLIKDGKLVFLDRLPYSKPYHTTIEMINSKLSLRLDDNYTKILSLSSEGNGRLNGNDDEIIRWTMSLNPTTRLLTMSNRLEVSNLDMTALVPYYDKYSPFVFRKGRFSGTLIYDFDNGNIGSTNEIRLSYLTFYVKKGYENAIFWQTTVQDLAKYFTSSTGDIVFDFKIKGEMSNPKFYLGPISKQAIAALAIDKISDAIKGVSETGGAQQGASQGPKSDIEKAKEYIDLFKGLLDKK